MTRETKFGLLLVLSLTTTFGFLVWKKMHQPKDLVATTESVDAAAGDSGDDPTPAALLTAQDEPATPPPVAAISASRGVPKRPTTRTEAPPREDALFTEDIIPAQPVTRAKPKLPVDLDERDSFAAPQNEVVATARPATAVQAEVDPFAAPENAPVAASEEPDPFASTAATAASAPQFEPNAGSLELPSRSEPVTVRSVPVEPGPPVVEADPFQSEPLNIPEREPARNSVPETAASTFDSLPPTEPSVPLAVPEQTRQFEPVELGQTADPLTDAAEPAVELSARSSVPASPVEVTTVPEPVLNLPVTAEPVAASVRRTTVTAAADPDPFLAEEAAPVRAPATPRAVPAPRAAAPAVEPDPFSAPAVIPEAPVRAPAHPLRAEPVPVRAEPAPDRPATRNPAPVAFAGETYIVQPNDNFWTISKKVYGTGRYFEALAHYNAGVVSDPSKMRPGLKIATPTEAELQSRYPKLLATTGTQTATNDAVSLGIPGDLYTVAAGDNFWEISKRLYGDGKYFRALEQHNSAIVPDPQKLQLGMRLAVPKAAWLQAKYPQLIAHAAPAVQDLKRMQPARYQPEEPAGFFMAAGEQPMYRVGTKDTLTDIAQNYLGRSSRWVQILEMNRDVLTDGNALSVGTVLRLPADASRVAVIESALPRR